MLLSTPERAGFEERAGVIASFLDDVEAVEGIDSDAYGEATLWLAQIAYEEGHVGAARDWVHRVAVSGDSPSVRSRAAGCLLTRFAKAGSPLFEALAMPSRPSPAWCQPGS